MPVRALPSRFRLSSCNTAGLPERAAARRTVGRCRGFVMLPEELDLRTDPMGAWVVAPAGPWCYYSHRVDFAAKKRSPKLRAAAWQRVEK